jgi:hypothetical protein
MSPTGRLLTSCLLALSIALLPGIAAAQTAPCKVVILPVEARRIPRAVVKLSNQQLRSKVLELTRCELVDDKATAAMRAMLKLPRRPKGADWVQLGQSLMADRVLVTRLTAVRGEIRIEIFHHHVATAAETRKAEAVPVARLLATLLRLAGEAVVLKTASAPPTAAAPATMPASAPTSLPTLAAAPASQPASAPTQPPAAPPPAPKAAISQPPARPEASVTASTETTVRPRPPDGFRPMAAAGLRAFYLFGEGRGGPALDLELGARKHNYRAGLLFRTYFGDRTNYLIGGRVEGGPRWGRFRLSLGVDLGFLFVPDNADDLDMLVASAHAIGVVIEWRFLMLHIDAFTLDFYLIPAKPELGQEVSAMAGFSSGVSAAFYF